MRGYVAVFEGDDELGGARASRRRQRHDLGVRPGLYRVSVAVTWSAQGVPVGVEQGIDVFIEFPTTASDNQAAGLVLNTEVGKWVALGGNAYHLTEATRRLTALSGGNFDSAPRLLAGYGGLLPDPERMTGDGGSPSDAPPKGRRKRKQ